MNIYDRATIRTKLEANRTVTEDGHWLYTGSLDSYGYGQLGIDYAVYKVNRLSLYVYTDDFDISNPDTLALHKCSEVSCFAPHHLEKGTSSKNALDRVRDGTDFNKNKMTCKNGHQFTESNTYLEKKKTGYQRHCKICRAQRLRELRYRRKHAVSNEW